jgi:hypothetical protein
MVLFLFFFYGWNSGVAEATIIDNQVNGSSFAFSFSFSLYVSGVEYSLINNYLNFLYYADTVEWPKFSCWKSICGS